jgi:hypothetical protein
MLAMTPPAAQPSTDSDDEDVAFAYMDFDGVDFGKDEVPVKRSADEEEDAIICGANDCEETPSYKYTADIVESSEPVGKSNESHIGGVAPNLMDEVSKQKRSLASIFISDTTQCEMNDNDTTLREVEQELLLPNCNDKPLHDGTQASDVMSLFDQLKCGAYADMLRSSVAGKLLGKESEYNPGEFSLSGAPFMMENIKLRALGYCCNKDTSNKTIYEKCLELELIGIASLNLFLQLNYTGPSMDRGLKPEEGESQSHPLDGIHPHGMFEAMATIEDNNGGGAISTNLEPIVEDSTSSIAAELTSLHSLKEKTTSDAFHNTVLSELASDGEWPFQVCRVPYFLLLARAILSMLAEPMRPFRNWAEENASEVADSTGGGVSKLYDGFSAAANILLGASLWNARAIVAHRRLITVRRDDDDGSACPTLWKEADAMFQRCLKLFCHQTTLFSSDELRNMHVAGSVMLEWGLAQHHFRKAGRGKTSFNEALGFVKLEVEVTGAEGKRTKYQTV